MEETLIREIAQVIAERFGKAAADNPQPAPISQAQVPLRPALRKMRMWAFRATCCTFPIAILELFVSFLNSLPLSIVTIISGIMLLTTVFLEVTMLCGLELQTEYKTNEGFSREYEFVPSIHSITVLLGLLSAAIVAMIIGFAGVHSWLSRSLSTNYMSELSPISAIYFSLVTFATVGYGDIVPFSTVARIVATIQICLGWISVALVLTVVIPWITAHHKTRLKKLLNKHKGKMQRTEFLLKEAGLGVYGDLNEIIEEAKRRLTQRENDNK